MTVNVLRLSHRLVRDDRVTTHVALVARAFGADKIYVVGGENHLKESIDRVSALSYTHLTLPTICSV